MFIGAHPDDESDIAPLLGKLCNDLNNECTILIVTKGEGGGDPEIRVKEMQEAAEVLNAKLIQWDLGNFDYPGNQENVFQKWSEKAGGEEELLNMIRSAMESESPDILITYDPRHGNTCHAEHRLIAALSLSALEESNLNPEVYLKEGVSEPFVKDPSQVIYDATEYSPSLNAETWQYRVLDLQAHASQKSEETVNNVKTILDNFKKIYLLKLEDAQENDDRYLFCQN